METRFSFQRNRSTILALICACVLFGPWTGVAPAADSALHRKIDAAIAAVNKKFKRNPTVGARIIEIPSGKVVYSLNADQLFKPASNMKIITTATALALLGGDYQFETRLAVRGNDLVVVGDGDPGLGDPKIAKDHGEIITAVFHRWADELNRRGMKAISGDLIIDDTLFDDQFVNPSWDPGQLQHWYCAPVGGLGFNDNCLDVEVWPSKSGQPVHFTTTPRLKNIEIVNRCISGRKGPPIIARLGNDMRFRLSKGTGKRMPIGPVTVVRPGLFFADACRTALSAKGIKINGVIRRERVRRPDGSLSPECEVIAVHRTPIAAVVRRANRDSQNYFAECLMKRAGYAAGQRSRSASPIGSWPTGRKAIKGFLGQIGVDANQMVFEDGSGLSHESRVSPTAITEVLRAMHASVVFSTFYGSLATSGGSAGTLRKRMRDIPGKVHAKTGLINGVRTLSGYVQGAQGRMYAFSILFNNIHGGNWPINDCHDKVCRLLASAQPE